MNSLELIGEEAEIQKDLCEKVRKIYKSIDSLYSLQKKHFATIEKIEEDKFKEIQRHNYLMEELRKREIENKIEKNKGILEIEELKTTLKM